MTSKNPYAGSAVGVVVDVVNQQLEAFHHLTILDKLALWASWAAAAGIFLTLGWMAMAPDDPYGAVSLLLRGRPSGVWFQAAGLAIVTSAIGTVLVGRTLPYAGPFAAALGLAVVSFRGGTSESLVIAAKTADGGTQSLALHMGMEALAWIAVMAIAFVIGSGIARWCFPRSTDAQVHLPNPANTRPSATFLGVAFAAALLAFNILGAGMHSREIRHTQVCFVVAASVWLGCYVAFRVVMVRGVLWYLAVVALLPLAGYAWAAFQSAPPKLPLSVPASIYLRVLPIQFVAVGFAGAIAAYWSNMQHWSHLILDDETESGDPEVRA